MTRAELEALGLDEDKIKATIKINGDDIEIAKAESKKEIAEIASKLEISEKALKDSNETVKKFKDLDLEGIQKETEALKLRAEKAEKEKSEIETKSAAKELFSKAKDDLSKNALVDEFMKRDLKFENGKFLGGEDVLKEMQEKYTLHFETKETNLNSNLEPKPNEGFDLGGTPPPISAKKSIKEELYG